MNIENVKRERWLNTRLSESEYQTVKSRFQKSTFLKMSEYSRSLLLGKPVKIIHRNQSMDELMEELILLRQELNYVGHNFNQAVKKLNSFAELPEAHYWKNAMDVSRNELEPCIKKIKDRMNNYADLWSQKLLAEKV